MNHTKTMGTGKRPGEDVPIPIASKIPRISPDTASDSLAQSDKCLPVFNLSDVPNSPPTQFHLKIVIDCAGKAFSNDTAALLRKRSPRPASQDDTATSGDSDDSYSNDYSDDDRSYPLAEYLQDAQTGAGKAEEKATNVEYLPRHLSQYDECSDYEWLESMEVVVTRANTSPDSLQSRVGFLGAKLIRRTRTLRGIFYKEMSKSFDEVTLLAFDLFDQVGNLKDDYQSHAVRKGLGMWGSRLDSGDILLIEDIIIEKPYRRLGLGKRMVTELLEVTKRKTDDDGFTAILWPESSKDGHFKELLESIVGDTGNIERPKVFDHRDPVTVAWARSLGFRRIGSSIWFGLACRPGLPIPDGDDYDPPMFDRANQDLLPETIGGEQNDSKFLKATQRYLQHTQPDIQRWLATDKEANTLLHLSALYFLPESVAWIMKQPASAQLTQMRNSSGNTPLEALLQKLEIVRTRSLSGTSIAILSDKFECHTIGMAKCIALLKGVGADSDEDLERFRYGCTCGMCTDGYFSPRMRKLLSAQASAAQKNLSQCLDTWSGPDWVGANDPLFFYFSDHFRTLLSRYKAPRRGCVRLYDHILRCLHTLGPPSKHAISSTFDIEDDERSVIKKFFKCGGSIDGAMFSVFRMAFYDEFWDGDFIRETVEDEGKKCRNDHELVLVARKCGYKELAVDMCSDDFICN